MTTATASFAARTVFRIGYGALELERLRDRRGEAVALLRRAVGKVLVDTGSPGLRRSLTGATKPLIGRRRPACDPSVSWWPFSVRARSCW
ncbi:hypothetical protein QBC98_002659 [Kitasatospora acidiphila]